MCTSITLQTQKGNTFFGRTMDFSYPLDPELYIVPKGYQWNSILNGQSFQNQYNFISIGQDISPTSFADGVNDAGFAAAVLYFPGYAVYDTEDYRDSSRTSIAALELLPYLLGYCSSVEHAARLLKKVRIVGTKDAVTQSVAPLHWIIADKNGRCAVIEKTENGLFLWKNPLGVLTNSPDFPWHMTNLRNYMNVEPFQKQEVSWDSVTLTPFGQGTGTFGLPGDYSPPSRFVRTAYQKSHINPPADDLEAVISCFHIMESVSIPKGVVMTDRQTPDYTQYTAFMNLAEGEYYFKTYDDNSITAARLHDYCPCSNIQSLGKLNQPVSFRRMAQN